MSHDRWLACILFFAAAVALGGFFMPSSQDTWTSTEWTLLAEFAFGAIAGLGLWIWNGG